MIHIEQITPQLTWRLRRDVLYPNQKMFEMEMDEDSHGLHFGAFKDDKLAGVVSLFQKKADFQFRKLAVDPSVQKMGIGNTLLPIYYRLCKRQRRYTDMVQRTVSGYWFLFKGGFLANRQTVFQKRLRL